MVLIHYGIGSDIGYISFLFYTILFLYFFSSFFSLRKDLTKFVEMRTAVILITNASITSGEI